MGKPLRVLVVEDVEQDALLLVRELKRGGFDVQFERVDTPEMMAAALTRQSFDVIIADYAMPRFSAPMALALMQERKLEVPFLIISGTVNEDIAVEVMRAGASDFMAKGKLARLVPAVQRELREVALRAERVRMREQLSISERMASVGTLAAGVAHEVNNPLAALLANLDFTIEQLANLQEDVRIRAGERLGEGAHLAWIATRLREFGQPLREAAESAERVRHIVRDLKVFSRSDEESRTAVDVHRVLDSMIRMAWNEIRHRARLVKDYGEVAPVLGNEGRLGQVFLNLIVNAVQAIPEGRAEQNEIRVRTRPYEQAYVLVEIHDTGAGMPNEVVSRIFDPFFTTKAIGEGTGLGLSICHRIISGLGGRIEVASEVGKGTVIRLILPAASAAPVAASAAPVAAPTPPPATVVAARRGRILVVDDEPALGLVVRRVLSAEHDVVVESSAGSAMKRLAGDAGFDVILCDLMMPVVTGMDLHAELLQRAPEQAAKIVFMTGGAFTGRAQQFLDRVPNLRIEKPFDVGQLRALIQRLLSQAASARG